MVGLVLVVFYTSNFAKTAAPRVGGRPLHLTACLLAKIFSRQIKYWNDKEIKDLNPSLTSTSEIQVVHRMKGSSSTSGFTAYLNTKCAPFWSGTNNECGPTGCEYCKSTITWPERF